MSNFEVGPISMIEVERMIQSAELQDRVTALISAALYGDDRERVREIVMQHLIDQHPDVVMAAIISVGHCARIDGTCDLSTLQPIFQFLFEDERYFGRLRDAINDIEMFTSLDRSDFELYFD